MKEYWINVYDGWRSACYSNKEHCINWNRLAYAKKLVLYRIHVKMKKPEAKLQDI